MGKQRMPPPKPTHTVFATASWALPASMSVSEGLNSALTAKMREVLDMSPSSTGPKMHILDGARTNQTHTHPTSRGYARPKGIRVGWPIADTHRR